MKLYEFNALDELEQIEVIWLVPAVGERFENGYKIRLFQVNDFYVELYHHLHRDSTEKIRGFENTDLLQPY